VKFIVAVFVVKPAPLAASCARNPLMDKRIACLAGFLPPPLAGAQK